MTAPLSATGAVEPVLPDPAAVLEGLVDGVIAIDDDGKIVFANPALADLLGWSVGDVVGQDVGAVFPGWPTDLPGGDAEAHLVSAAKTGEGDVVPVQLVFGPPRKGARGRVVTVRRGTDSELASTFLAAASVALATSLDAAVIIEQATDQAVPFLADWIVVRGPSNRVESVAHVDDAMAMTLVALEEAHTPACAITQARQRALAKGRGEIVVSGPVPLACDEAHAPLAGAVGTRAALVLPLSARGHVVGSIVCGTTKSVGYRVRDLGMALDWAERVALALDNARLFSDRAEVAAALQRTLLPPMLPDIPGFSVAARFLPGREGLDVGGDFYDAFATGPDEWVLAVGDVCGTGAEAAALTGLVRHAARAAAMQTNSPALALQLVNQSLLREAGNERFCTMAYCHLRLMDDGQARTSVATAGHPAPFVLDRAGDVMALPTRGTLLGVFRDIDTEDHFGTLGCGDALVLYTDGVTEARGAAGIFGEHGLQAVLERRLGRHADDVAAMIVDAVLRHSGGRLTDDLAVLVLQAVSP